MSYFLAGIGKKTNTNMMFVFSLKDYLFLDKIAVM